MTSLSKLYLVALRLLSVLPVLLVASLLPVHSIADENYSSLKNDRSALKKKTWPVYFGGYFKNRLNVENNFNLNESKPEDISDNKAEVGLSLLLEAGSQLDFFLQAELSRVDFIENETSKTEKGSELVVDELYFDVSNEQQTTLLRVGRQAFVDEMEWFYDANLDGLRLFYQLDTMLLELSVTEKDRFDGNHLNAERETDEKITNYIFVARNGDNKDSSLGVYLIYRDEEEFEGERPEDLFFVGFQSVSQSSWFRHWVNAAYVTGERERANDVRDIEAFGYDLGVSLVGKSSLKPSITLGYAFGSGDAERNEGKDENFRQTDLQDNYYRFGGVAKFRYLGEVFDPELTNISIATLGLGIRPTKKSSIDIVYHIYEQDKAVDRLTGTNIDRDPQGRSRELGSELDFIIGIKETKNVDMKAILAMFEPGEAFKSNADDAYFLSFEIEFEF